MGVPFDRNFNSISRRDHQIISYERRDYESVDEKSLCYAMSGKNDEKQFSPEGLNAIVACCRRRKQHYVRVLEFWWKSQN